MRRLSPPDIGAVLQPHGAGAVRKHPAQEVLLEGESRVTLQLLAATLVLGVELRACISVEATSEPQATALRLSPLATLSQAYFSAVTPHRRMPASGPPPRVLGEVAQLAMHHHRVAGHGLVRRRGAGHRAVQLAQVGGASRPRMAAALSCALFIAGSPLSGSIT